VDPNEPYVRPDYNLNLSSFFFALCTEFCSISKFHDASTIFSIESFVQILWIVWMWSIAAVHIYGEHFNQIWGAWCLRLVLR
jgi:hypothetical protein